MSRFPDPTAIARIENMPLRARLIVEGALTGMHRARLHGSSVEFAEHKEYSPGDEIKHIDWKAYAKLDRYYVKQFEQESQLTAYMVLDSSASMEYAGKGLRKLDYASHIVAALAYMLIKQRDRVGMYVFGDEKLDHRFIPPRARPAHLNDILSVIDDVNARGASGAESPAAALERIAEMSNRRRSLIVLASDLFDADDRALDLLRMLKAQRHDVVVFHVLDRDELEFPFEGLTSFESYEDTKHKMLVNPSAIRREYKRRLAEFLARVKRDCQTAGIEYQLVPTDQPFELALLEFLTTRARMSAGAQRAWNF